MELKKRILAIAVTAAFAATTLGMTSFAAPEVDIDDDNDKTYDTDEDGYLHWTADGDDDGDIDWIRWSSDDDSVVEIEEDGDGEFETHNPGTARITLTVKFEDANRTYTDRITLTVRADDDWYDDRNDRDDDYYDGDNSNRRDGERVYDPIRDEWYYYYEDDDSRNYLDRNGVDIRTDQYNESRTASTAARGPAVNFDRSVSLTKAADNTTAVNAVKASAAARLDNYASVTVDTLHAAAAARANGFIDFDTRVNGALMGRLQIAPANAANLSSGTIQVGVHSEDSATESVYNLYNNIYSNSVHVIKCDQTNYGMSVKIFANIGAGVNAGDLVFYSYNAEKNSHSKLNVTNVAVDSNGWLSFNTTTGGNIVISEGGALSK